MSLKTKIVRYVEISKDEGVSYGWTWKANRRSIVGVLPIGYADGYHRLLSNNSQALVCGHRVSVVGNVCMDYFMIDVTDLVQNKVIQMHEPVEVTIMGYDSFGHFISAEELATNAKTISYEIFTSVSERVFREVLTTDAKELFA
jgi:alanine racemase